MSARAFAVICALAALAAVSAEVVQLDAGNFDDYVDGSQPALVEFYAPWCGHCKNLAPEYEKVGATYKRSDGVLIAKVDADAERDLGSKFGVKGFPTLKWFPAGSTEPQDYDGGRSAEDFVEFINGKTGLNRRLKTVPSDVVALTDKTFDSIVMDPSKNVLVEFYAPWCGHCKNLAPTYEKLGTTFVAEENVVVAKMDATKYNDISQRFGVSGFPTIKFFAAGDDKEAEPYEGSREGEAFVTFLNEKAGTARKLGGGLNSQAGRIAEFDTLAAAFFANPSEELLAEAEAIETDAPTARHYIKAMKKILAKGTDYVAKETTRLAGMVESGSVSPKKKTLFQTRLNILASFSADADEAEL